MKDEYKAIYYYFLRRTEKSRILPAFNICDGSLLFFLLYDKYSFNIQLKVEEILRLYRNKSLTEDIKRVILNFKKFVIDLGT